MTNKEVINFLQSRIDLIDKYYPDVKNYREALVIAIEALEKEHCEDCISRQVALVGLASIAKAKAKSDAQKSLMGRVMFFTEQLPPVTPRPRAGHWIVDVDRWGDIVTTVNGYRCSECNNFNTDRDKYCPNCGCRMKGESE